MRVVGILRVKNEADLLPAVLANVENGVEEIIAYDDNSTDDTLDILHSHPSVTVEPFNPEFTVELQKTQTLEQRVKERFPYLSEEVWVALLAGDLFWLNKTPHEAAVQAHEQGYDLQNGIAIDFGRWEWEEGTDTWPNWHMDVRKLCRWCAIIEELPVVWKVSDYTVWKRLPWPGGFKKRNVGKTIDFPFLEHQGKRSPKYHQWKYLKGSRQLYRGTTVADWESYDFAYEHGRKLGYWGNGRRIRWDGLETIKELIRIGTLDKEGQEKYFANYGPKNDIFPTPREDL